MSACRNGRDPGPRLREQPRRRAPVQSTSTCLQSFWGVIRGERRRAFVRAETGIPAPLPDRQAERRRRAPAREPGGERPRGEADTTLPVRPWNLISAPLVRVSCRQKTAEQNYYNRFWRTETVSSWFVVVKRYARNSGRSRRCHHANRGSLIASPGMCRPPECPESPLLPLGEQSSSEQSKFLSLGRNP